MGGEIKVVKKNGPGTMMQLYLLLNTPTEGIELPPPLNIMDNTVVSTFIFAYESEYQELN